jgi:hypothetical protein
MLSRHTATNKLLGSTRSAKRASKNAPTFGIKALGTRAGTVEDWRAGGAKRNGKKLDRNAFRDGR